MSESRAVAPSLGLRIGGGLLAALLLIGAWWVVSSYRFSSLHVLGKNRLKQIGHALHSYHDTYKCFPPAYVRGPDGSPWHSWRTLILPYMGQESLYAQYDFGEPWNGPHNRLLLEKRPAAYASPFAESNRPSVTTALAVVSRRTMWPAYFSSRIKDFFDGTSNTIMLWEDLQSEVAWTEPRDLTEKQAMAFLMETPRSKQTPPPAETFDILMADGSWARRMSSRNRREMMIGLLTPRYRDTVVPDALWPPDLLAGDTRSGDSLPAIEELGAKQNAALLLTPRLPLDLSKNALYCATSQLAWDRLRPSTNEAVVTSDSRPEVDDLNAHPFPANTLDEASFHVGVVKLESNDSVSRLSPEIAAKIRSLSSDLGPRALAIECRLHKSVRYPEELYRFPEPLSFGTGERIRSVASFGWPGKGGAAGEMALPTNAVTVASHDSNDNFVVVLNTTASRADEIILARVPPESSLEQTWMEVRKRLANSKQSDPNREIREQDVLRVPVLAIGLLGEMGPLRNLRIPVESWPERILLAGFQSIQFKLDEFGAELLSDNCYVVGEDVPGPPEDRRPPRLMIFDQPFFMAMREQASDTPYFQAWIASPELMEPAVQAAQ